MSFVLERERTVLRDPFFGDIHLGEDLDTGDHGVMQFPGRRRKLVKHTVHAVTDIDLVLAGVSENIAEQDTKQGGQEAGLIGGLIGAGGQVGAGLASSPATDAVTASGGGEIERFLKGGVVDGRASVPGNSPKNDTVPAVLSPGEVVLPRTVAQNPQPDRVMAFLNRIRQAKQPTPAHPHDIKSVLDALALRRGGQ